MMEMIILVVAIFVCSIISMVFGVLYLRGRIAEMVNSQDVYTPPPVYVDTEGLERRMKDIPNKVLQSIQGSINTHKGALGELIGYLELRGRYDRIIPIGNIVDFICIRFPTELEEGTVDFVDVKTGGASRLSKDQRSLQNLISEKKIGFVKLKVTDSKIAGDVS